MTDDVALSKSLKQLSLNAKNIVKDGISTNTLKPEDETFLHWKVENFQYTDTGVTGAAMRSEEATRQSWFKAVCTVHDVIMKLPEYEAALKQMTSVFGENPTHSHYLEWFLKNVTACCISNPGFTEEQVAAKVDTFLKDLYGEPIRCGASVELDGIVLRPEKIELADGISIRQTKIEDLERELPSVYGPMFQHTFHPTAILNVELSGRQPTEIQVKAEHAIAVLRLFKVGSVKSTICRMHSESVTNPFWGTAYSGDRLTAMEKSLITQEDVPKLKKFWHEMNNSIPKSFYAFGEVKTDYRTIAYNRYADALLQSSIMERRIADAIMGLEALFFKPNGEKQELIYRLRIRVSKLLSLFGYDPHEVKRIINDAYEIRSLFAHGGQLDYKRISKLEERHKGVRNILLSVLDYLRVSLILMILVHKEKEEFIDLIDDSLIDKKKEETLTSIVAETKRLIQ